MNKIFKNYLHIVKRFKTSTILNILGLSAAFTVFIILIAQVNYDFRFNRNYKHADEIYLMSFYHPFKGGEYPWTSTQMGDNNISKSPLVTRYMTYANFWKKKLYSKDALPETAIEETFHAFRGHFQEMFELTVLEGDISHVFEEGNKIAISQTTSQKYFGKESPIGKTLIDYNNGDLFIVDALVEDLPKNNSFSNAIFGYLPEQPTDENSFFLYLQVKPENKDQLISFINSKDFLGAEAYNHMQSHEEARVELRLVPFTDIHLNYRILGRGDLTITLSLLAIAILTLLIAYINFINFSVAMAPARIKTLTLQHILGLGRNMQIVAIIAEAIFSSIIALAFAFIFVKLIGTSRIADLFTVNIDSVFSLQSIAILTIGCIVIGIIVGIYPARYITNFNVLETLKGSSTSNVNSSKLRSVLLTIQFTSAIILLIVTCFIKLQHSYMINYSWGIEKENIVYINLENKKINHKTFTDELMKDPRFVDCTFSRFSPGSVHMGWGRDFEDKSVNLAAWPVSDNYLDFFGVKMIAGNNFPDLQSPKKIKIIFNETFIKKYGFEADKIIGKNFPVFTDPGQIIGVAKDINFESLREPVKPMAFVTLESQAYGIAFLKLSGKDLKGAIQQIEQVWAQQTKEPLDIKFLDKDLENLYRSENNLSKLIGLFCLVTIVIAMMGIYGLITFNTKYRKKEIAIRKINGANEKQIIGILNRAMLYQLFIAFVIACPVSYWLVEKWLSNFAHRTEIFFWVFPVAGLVIMSISGIAVSYQTYKASTSNPIQSLKSE